ncbi:MAG: alpha-L-fucosidase [Promethearchaeota archaeon]
MHGEIQAPVDFLDLRFGEFIHFGLYSQGMEHEWHMWLHKMSLEKYKRKFLSSFNPDPREIEGWVKVAKLMGAKYITCTAKHCDGFCLWDTSVPHGLDPDYHIKNTAFYKVHGRGVLDFLFEAGRKHGIRIGLYYAVVDWSWSRKLPFRPPAHRIGDSKRLNGFLKQIKGQLLDLVDRYPGILLLWFDGHQFYRDGFERLHHSEIYKMLHDVRPGILIGSNSGTVHEDKKVTDVDFLIYENMAHLGEMGGSIWPRRDPNHLPAEVCLTINKHWGYNSKDKNYKNPRDILRLLLYNALRDSNTLLNFGPRPDGFISDDEVSLAREIGVLVSRHAKALYSMRSYLVAEWGGIIKNIENGNYYLVILDDVDHGQRIRVNLPVKPAHIEWLEQDGNEFRHTGKNELTIERAVGPAVIEIKGE